MYRTFKKTLATLLLAFACFAIAPNAYAQSCDEELASLERDLDIIEEDCLDAAKDAEAERDRALRELAAESAVLKVLRVNEHNLQIAFNREMARRIRAEEQLKIAQLPPPPKPKPQRGLWALGGAGVGAALVIILAVAL